MQQNKELKHIETNLSQTSKQKIKPIETNINRCSKNKTSNKNREQKLAKIKNSNKKRANLNT
jgi:hypothetical protein